MLVLLLAACHVDVDEECVTERREVADDEVLGDLGFTVADVAAALTGAHTFAAAHADGTTTEVTLDLARGDGVAMFEDARWVTTEEVRPGLFEQDTQMLVVCDPRVDVAFDTTLTTADASLLGTGSARITAGDFGQSAPGNADLAATLDDGTLTPDGDGPTRISADFADGAVAGFQAYEGEHAVLEWPRR